MIRAGDKKGSQPSRIAVVGGGISGLSTAYFLSKHLHQSEAEIILFEASSRWGGVIRSERSGEFLWEGGPDSFVSQKPQALELCRELGLVDDLVQTRSIHRQAYVVFREKLYALPLNRSAFLKTPLLTWKGRLRAVIEPLIPSSGLEDESVSDFIARRLGREVAEKIFEPLVVGVYGGDPNQLSIRSTLPHLYKAENSRGGLTRALLQMVQPLKPRGGGDRKESLISLKRGMGQLVQSLLERLRERVDLRLESNVCEVTRIDPGFQVRTGKEAVKHFDVVILATPACISARILASASSEVANLLQQIHYVSSVIVALGYDEEILAGRMGTGFLVPPTESKVMSACTWMNQKFPGRCPQGYALLRCFIGGNQAGKWISSDDEELVDRMKSELMEILAIGRDPISRKIYRWQAALPQYQLGHHERTQRLAQELKSVPGLYLVGNFLDGVGISDCIRHAARVSESVREMRA
ncbi:protoporphyrinogen oxidase [Acidobacteria bacterium AH-259-D05]|nr:protoporphyrinogen oxidase [Acidobacteria bacterium AH-259-D05]